MAHPASPLPEPPLRSRRAVLSTGARGLAGAVVAAGLSGCGFSLRSAGAMDFSRLQLVGLAPQSTLGQELRRQLGGRVQLVESAAQAEVVLRVEGAQREKVVTGLTAAGLVRDLSLRQRLRFSLSTPQGRALIAPTDLVLQRDMATNESAALAKAREEDEIFRVLERDVVLQMVRRLEAVVMAAPAPAPEPPSALQPLTTSPRSSTR